MFSLGRVQTHSDVHATQADTLDDGSSEQMREPSTLSLELQALATKDTPAEPASKGFIEDDHSPVEEWNEAGHGRQMISTNIGRTGLMDELLRSSP